MKEIRNLVKIEIQSNLFADLSKNSALLDFSFLGKKILFISDEKIWQKNQSFFDINFLNNFEAIFFLKNPKANIENSEVIKREFLTKNCDAIVAFGSGTINDLAKFVAANLTIKYAIIASAASMNGYLSINSSIEVDGHKKTFFSTLPSAVYIDLTIIKNSPIRMIKAGIGDSMCFYSCWFDWYLSKILIDSEFNQECFLMLKNNIDNLIKNYQKFNARDESFVKNLIEILLISGYSMTLAKGSYPASQSEHLIAHCLNMKYQFLEKKFLHGEMIAITTIQTVKRQQKLMQKILKNQPLEIEINKKENIDEMLNYFSSNVAKSCLEEYQKKITKIQKSQFLQKKDLKNFSVLISDEDKKTLKEILMNEQKLKKFFNHFSLNYSIDEKLIKKNEFKKAVEMAKYIRDRFTCLDVSID